MERGWFKEPEVDWHRKVWEYIKEIDSSYELVVTIRHYKPEPLTLMDYTSIYATSEKVIFGINKNGSYKRLYVYSGRLSIQWACKCFYENFELTEKLAAKTNTVESMGADWVHPPKVEPVIMKKLDPKKLKEARKKIKKLVAKRKKG